MAFDIWASTDMKMLGAEIIDNLIQKLKPFINCKTHCEKYRNFTWFPGVELLRKGTVSA